MSVLRWKDGKNKLFPVILLLVAGLLLSCRPAAAPSTPAGSTEAPPVSTDSAPPPTETSADPSQPAPTSTPVHLEGCVDVRSLRIRSGPGTDYQMVGGLQYGDCVTVLGRNRDASWGQITFKDLSGWVSLDYITLQGDIQAVAVVVGDVGQEAAPVVLPSQEAVTQSAPLTPTVPLGPFHIEVGTAQRGTTVKTFSFEYACRPVTLDLSLSEAQVEEYASRNKPSYYTGQLSGDGEAQYYKKFLRGKYDDEVIASLVAEVRSGLGIEKDDQLIPALTSLVQNIEYDCDKLFSYQNLEDHDYQTNYPLETLFTQKGVCGDSSILLAKMLQDAGYGAAFLLYEQANHMAVGIRCPVDTATYLYGGVGYCYIETTDPSRIGVKPEKIGGDDFTETPQIIPVSKGKSFWGMVSLAESMQAEVEEYGDYILQLAGCEEISTYKSIRRKEYKLHEYESELDSFSDQLDQISAQLKEEIAEYEAMGCKGELAEDKYNDCLSKYHEIETLQARYNDLVKKYRRLYEEYESYYQGYMSDFNAFQDLMENANQSCSIVSREDPEMQEESGEGGG